MNSNQSKNETQTSVFLLSCVGLEELLVPKGFVSHDAYLNSLVIQGLEKRFPNVTDTSYLRERIEEELGILPLDHYTLLVLNDCVSWAKKQGILCNLGRSTASSSLVCYCLGLTDIDPVENNLIVERFCNNRNLATKVDIYFDADFKKKDLIVNYIAEKYSEYCTISSPEKEDYTELMNNYPFSLSLRIPITGVEILSKLSEAQNMIQQTDSSFFLDTIPENDTDTYNMISRGDTDKVFQLESLGIQKYLRLLQEVTFDDLLALTSMYRPGSLQFVSTYIDCKLGKTEITYPDEALADILKPTYGLLVYQEQLMQILHDYAGFDFRESDEIRRTMQKKGLKKHPEIRNSFIAGAQNLGHSPDSAEKVFEFLYTNACYAFPKCHALGQVQITYRHAYIKCHYSEVFTSTSYEL